MYQPSQAFDGRPIWQDQLRRGDVVLFRFPVADTDDIDDTPPKLRPCLVLEIHDRLGRRTATLAYGTSATTRANRGYNIIVTTEAGMATAGLDRPTRFVGIRRITVGLDNSKFGPAEGANSQVVGRLDPPLMERMNAIRARIQAEADIARERRRGRRAEQRRWQREGRRFVERNGALRAASTPEKGQTND